MSNKVRFTVQGVPEKYKIAYKEDCIKYNMFFFRKISLTIAFLYILLIVLQRLLSFDIVLYSIPYSFGFVVAALINIIFYVLFKKNRNIDIRRLNKYSILQKAYIALLIGHAVFSSLISMKGSSPQTALYTAIICFTAIGLSFSLVTINTLMWTSYITLAVLANVFAASRVAIAPYLINAFFINILMTAVSVIIHSSRIEIFLQKVFIWEQQDKLREVNERLEELTKVDSLTEILNRRTFDERIAFEWIKCENLGVPLSVIMLDIDFFKSYNDLYGHQQGDVCLKEVAKALEGSLKRNGDEVFRYGGEEFVMLLPNTDREGAKSVAQRAINAVSILKLPHEKNTVKHVTISAGVHSVYPSATELTYGKLVECADKALYAAKQNGRNRSEIYRRTP